MLIRYPGSKAKLSAELKALFPEEMYFEMWAKAANWEYREPFFGAGAVGFDTLNILPKSSPVWINDIDPGMHCLWQTVLDQPRQLMSKVHRFTPSAESFYQFKEHDGDTSVGTLECGFRKLALHQMSVSGFGAKSGGPLGGRDQTNAKYPVNCRWNPSRLCKHITDAHKILRKFGNLRITNGDFEAMLRDAPANCFIYLDPPYVEKGAQLYKFSMDEAAHRRLAAAVKNLRCPWVLSYDDHPLVRELYSWAEISEIHVTYTNAIVKTDKRPKNREVVITPRSAAA